MDLNQTKMVQVEVLAAVAPAMPLTHPLGSGVQAFRAKVITVLTVTVLAAPAAVVVVQVLLVLSATVAQV